MNQWIVDLTSQAAAHPSGVSIKFRGIPETSHFDCTPEGYIREMGVLELARLLRTGVEAYREAYAEVERPMVQLNAWQSVRQNKSYSYQTPAQ